MHNILLDERSAHDIDGIVSKILHDLDDPEPPLSLETIRDLLRLDRAYYSSTDADALQETVHRLRVGAKQVIERPSLLLEVVRMRQLKALWVPDRKRILIDSEIPSPKQRWGEAHEIGHSLIPWHDSMMHGDQNRTLSIACEELLEAEANYAAGRILFLQDAFSERLLSSPVSFDRIRALSTEFGNTITSTLWRSIESLPFPAFGLVSAHPRLLSATQAGQPVRYFLRSPSFEQKFPMVTALPLFTKVRGICWGNRGPIGGGEIVLADAAGAKHLFVAEVFYNGYEALTLGIHQRDKATITPASR